VYYLIKLELQPKPDHSVAATQSWTPHAPLTNVEHHQILCLFQYTLLLVEDQHKLSPPPHRGELTPMTP
jgi:hypothetical protein